MSPENNLGSSLPAMWTEGTHEHEQHDIVTGRTTLG